MGLVLLVISLLSAALVIAAVYLIAAATCWVDNMEFGLLHLSYKWLSSADGCWMRLVVYKLSSFILLSSFMLFLIYIAQYFVKPTLVGCTRSFVDMSRPHVVTLVSGLHVNYCCAGFAISSLVVCIRLRCFWFVVLWVCHVYSFTFLVS